MVVREETAHRVCFELVGQKYEAPAAATGDNAWEHREKSRVFLCVFFYMMCMVFRSFYQSKSWFCDVFLLYKHPSFLIDQVLCVCFSAARMGPSRYVVHQECSSGISSSSVDETCCAYGKTTHKPTIWGWFIAPIYGDFVHCLLVVLLH